MPPPPSPPPPRQTTTAGAGAVAQDQGEAEAEGKTPERCGTGSRKALTRATAALAGCPPVPPQASPPAPPGGTSWRAGVPGALLGKPQLAPGYRLAPGMPVGEFRAHPSGSV